MNNEERKVKLFELGRALSYTSDILEMRREIKALESKIECIEKERIDWSYYYDSLSIKEEQNIILQIRGKLSKDKAKLQTKIEKLEEKMEAYLGVVQGLCTYIFSDSDFNLASNEIDINFIDEYIFILSDVEVDGDYLCFDEMFQDQNDFAELILKYYGDASFKLIKDILTETFFQKSFDYYFDE